MTREILFKAKRKNWRELPKEEWWVEGYYMPRPNSPGKPRYYIVPLSQAKRYEIDPETLCQSTGMVDRNRNLIYKNDICVIRSSNIDEEDGYFIVKWDDECAKYVLEGESLAVDFDYIYGSECEIIGNIFDNPELLGGAE